MKTRIQQGFTLIELLVVITIIAILASLAVPTFSKIQEKGYMTKGISNCRQIITALRIYSSDYNGMYPDLALAQQAAGGGGGGGGGGAATTANACFRELFKSGSLDNEMIFGCPSSKDGNPDGNIGKDAEHTEAVMPGENHWAMTGNLTDSASGSYPLVYENPVSGTWPSPTWNCDAAGTGAIGRSWSGGKVIVGMNDSSVSALPCTSSKGTNELGGQKNKSSSENNVFNQNDTSNAGTDAPKILPVEAAGG